MSDLGDPMNSERFPFFKTFILPMFWVFLIPVCGVVFGYFAIAKYDTRILDAIVVEIDARYLRSYSLEPQVPPR
jgi:hypothetical protein